MVTFVVNAETFAQFQTDSREGAETAGFFSAEFDRRTRSFFLCQWRPIPATAFESHSEYHLLLRESVTAEIIKWAWDENVSLVEAHSHGIGPARFSWTDLRGLEEWVPHVWWRLQGRPYGALVTAADTLDALAWIEDAEVPEQVTDVQMVDGDSIRPTGLTLVESLKPGESL